MRAVSRFFLFAAFALALSCLAITAKPDLSLAQDDQITIFAAASTTNAITDIGKLYEEKGLGKVVPSFASSSTLAKQIEQGAPADVFLSANTEWMDYLAKANLVDESSRKNLLANRIALIVPANSEVKSFEIKAGNSLLSLLGQDGRLAVGDPAHVPVGMYGKEALENLKLWDDVKDRLAPAKDVRAGLALVELGEAPLGLVYESDVAASEKVRIIGLFPADSHPEIIYPVAAISGGNTKAAQKFIDFLSTLESKTIFKKYGFEGI